MEEAETTCSICYAEFLDADDLKVHMKELHRSEDSFTQPARPYSEPCHFCTSVFTNIQDYAIHIRDTHVTSLKCCKYCTRLFRDQDALLEHQNKHKIYPEQSLISCSQCSQMFSSNMELDQHEYTTHFDAHEGVMLHSLFSVLAGVLNMKPYQFLHSLGSCKVYSCVCDYSNGDVLEYVNHLKLNNCESVVCDYCTQVFTSRNGLSRHYKGRYCPFLSKAQELKRTCKQCLKKIPGWNYNQHIRVCKMVKCNLCAVICKTVIEMQAHQSANHPKAIVMTACKFCRKEFVGTVSLSKHINRIHKPHIHLYKYKCVHCENRFYMHPKDLLAHLFSKHPELNPYECKICNMNFRVRKKFTIHIKMVHDSKGFVEFDENYNVFFTATKSDKPFQPTSLFGPSDMGINDSQTEAETDVPTDIQTETEDQDLKAQKKVTRKPLKVRFKEEDKSNKKNINELVLTETEVESEMETKQKENRRLSIRNKIKKENTDTELEDESEGNQKAKIENRKRRRSINEFKKKELLSNMVEIMGNSEGSSEDEPLLKVKKREKLKKFIRAGRKEQQRPNKLNKINKTNKKKFTCTICKKYCYTFQNYHHHISLHFKGEAKKCVKCNKQFPSKSELVVHVENDHKSSRLTETLKGMLEKRKLNQNYPQAELTSVEKFQRTIKKVNIPHSQVTAKITKVNEELSAKNFLESFIPDEGVQAKPKPTCEIRTCVSVRPIDKFVFQPPLIKITKFIPKHVDNNVHLALPVRFQDRNKEIHKVNVTLVRNEVTNDDSDNHNNDDMDHYEEVVEHQENTETVIPDVAEEQEVLAEKPYNIPHTLVLPKEYLHATSQIRIAHMLPEKPYFKIIKMEDVFLKPEESVKKAPSKAPEGPIELPNGTKLVNVNPLAHLMGDKSLESILGKPRGKTYYKGKNEGNIQTAIAKAMQKLQTKKNEMAAKKDAKKEVEKGNVAQVRVEQ